MDLAQSAKAVWYKSCTKLTLEWYAQNCPQILPFEEFQALTKVQLRKHTSAAETIQQFEKDQKKVSKHVDKMFVLNLMMIVHKNRHQLAYNHQIANVENTNLLLQSNINSISNKNRISNTCVLFTVKTKCVHTFRESL